MLRIFSLYKTYFKKCDKKLNLLNKSGTIINNNTGLLSIKINGDNLNIKMNGSDLDIKMNGSDLNIKMNGSDLVKVINNNNNNNNKIQI